MQLLFVLSGALLTRFLTIGNFVTKDEKFWMVRSNRFADALMGGRLDEASVTLGERATMPGVSTMWLGSLGRLVWSVGQDLGLVDEQQEFVTSLSGLWTSQAMVAIATALLVTLVVALLHRWAGWGAAAVAAVLLVSEPWITAHGSVLHTDELTALFGVAGLLVLALAFDVPDRFACRRPVLIAALGGLLVMQSPLTKLLGLPFGVGALAMIVFALWRDRPSRSARGHPRLFGQRLWQLAAAAGAALVAVPLSWPAMLFDPSTQISALVEFGGQAGQGHGQFFLGEPTSHPGWLYYAVVLPMRMTPWFFLGAVVSVPLALAARATRARAIWVLVWAVPATLVISSAHKQFDRYGLVLFVPMALLVGLGVGRHLERLLERRPPLRVAATTLAVGAVLFGAVTAPWGLLYFNPVLGGGSTAEEVMLVGWGEGWELAVDEIREQQKGDCAGVSVAGARKTIYGNATAAPLSWFGVPCSAKPAGEPTYVIAYVNQVQRVSEDELDRVLAGREHVGTVEIRGITVATIWR